MEIIKGNKRHKKIVIAQEIAFAKVLAGNNKTLRDRAVKKLQRWLTARGNGNWEFTEDEFIRISTGLFYCMWMSDKFLVQEELAENISQLIHCFEENSDSALLFIKCFNKRLLMEWEGLDQHRIDKFNMLVRRFLRQSFEYCRRKNWNETIFRKLMNIFYNVVLHEDNCLGFMIHFINIYAEELAKVGRGDLETKIVLAALEPFVKLISKSRDERILQETEEFFKYLMSQTDVGIDYEERFQAWKQLGCPGTGPDCLVREELVTGNDEVTENGHNAPSDEEDDEDDDECKREKPLDPRAGSVHVYLPQIPLNIDRILKLFKKYEHAKQTSRKGRGLLKSLSQKFETLKRGKFPSKIKRDTILDEKFKKRRHTAKNARQLLKFTEKLDEGPVRTKELKKISRELEEDSDDEGITKLHKAQDLGSDDDYLMPYENGIENEEENQKREQEFEGKEISEEVVINNKKKKKKSKKKKKNNVVEIMESEGQKLSTPKRRKSISEIGESKSFDEKYSRGESERDEEGFRTPKNKTKKAKKNSPSKNDNKISEETAKSGKKRARLTEIKNEEKKRLSGGLIEEGITVSNNATTPVKKRGIKRKILSNWQIQELDTSSPEYSKIITPKIIRLERRIDRDFDAEENQEPEKVKEVDQKWKEREKEDFFPTFWSKVRAKVNKKKNNSKGNVFLNPFAEVNGESKSPGLRRISFALDRNMAQENEEYLKEVKNSPKVPFDGSKKPGQSALKSGLAPSPVNPFYRFKKIKF